MGLRRLRRRAAERWARIAAWIEQLYEVQPKECFLKSQSARTAVAASTQVWSQCDRLLSDENPGSVESLLRSSVKVSDVGVLSRILVDDRLLEYSFARLFAEFCRHRLWMLAPYQKKEKATLRHTLHRIGFYEIVSWGLPGRNPPFYLDRTIGWQSSGEYLSHQAPYLDSKRKQAPQLWCVSRWPIVESSIFVRRGLPAPWLPTAKP